MNETKAWWQSKTIWGAIVTVASLALTFFKVQIDPQTQQVLVNEVTAVVSAVGALVGTVLTIYGRFKATKKIK